MVKNWYNRIKGFIEKRVEFMDYEDQEPLKIIENIEKAEIPLAGSKQSIKNINGFKEVFSYAVIILFAFLAANLIHRYVFTLVKVDGPSMQPTLQDEDLLILWRFNDYERKDIIVFKDPDGVKGVYLIKRLIAIPGDEIEYKDHALWLNGQVVNEPYIKANLNVQFTLKDICELSNTDCQVEGKVQIPEGYYFVLGDNRTNSKDGNDFGLIKKDQVIGEVSFRIKRGFGFLN
jgi:signal peptidase I